MQRCVLCCFSQFRTSSDLDCVCMDLNSTTTVLTLFFTDSLFTISDLLLVACTGEKYISISPIFKKKYTYV